jgi:antitoxin component of MazEF toxin-antitoxin module
MRVRVQRWGESLAPGIPRPLAEGAAVKDGTVVEGSISNGRPAAAHDRRGMVTLQRLRASASRANLHGEVDPGLSVGEET